jgi:hypothetical protein
MNRYIYTWKCHKEIPWVAILNKQKMSFFFFFSYIKSKREGGMGPVLVGEWLVLVGKGGCGEMVNESEYSTNPMSTCM